MTRRTLVTGATGFIGAALARALAARGDEVTVLVRAGSRPALLEDLPLRRHVADLTDPEALRGCCDGMDLVFHVAGDVSYRRADRERQWATNVDGTVNLLREAERAGVGRFVHTSSIAAVGVPEGGPVPVDETFAFNGHRFGLQYFISKRAAEEAVLRSAARGLPAVIVNPGTVYGPGDINTNGGRLLLLVHRKRMFLAPPGGLCVCSIEDVVQGHIAAAERGRAGERYILGGPNLPLRDLLMMATQIVGKRSPLLTLPGAAVRALRPFSMLLERLPVRELYLYRDYLMLADKFMYFSSAKAQRELGYTISPFEPALRATFAWYREQGMA